MIEITSQWAAVGLSALALAISVVSARASRNKGEIDQIGRRLDAAEDRITRVEGEVAHLPDKDTAHRMEMAIARLEGRLETMDERLKPVAAMASRMQDAMLERGK
jgi:predicted  nucleic acid-binding Zn-ribbon protein